MARKAKIPQEFLDFKLLVEQKGLKVMISRSYENSMWIATVIQGNKCIWHNDANPKTLSLSKFWESTAWKTYEKSLAKN
jgi:hypothetical protein